jgi:hypothetical protein
LKWVGHRRPNQPSCYQQRECSGTHKLRGSMFRLRPEVQVHRF